VSAHIEEWLRRLVPGAELIRTRAFGADADDIDDTTEKGIGYGEPIRITFHEPSGAIRDVVLHTATGDSFGHDRRADRAAEMLLAFDTFPQIPRHVAPVDVGYIEPSGKLTSAGSRGEFYLVTEFAPGAIYAHDLRELAGGRELADRDRRRCDALADYLAGLHVRTGDPPACYTRAIRDLVGHGEGIFGLVDGFGPDVPAAPPARLRDIELACVEWRWRLRGREDRISVTHGDFHPFNILFDGDCELAVLDAARGCRGDPADDVVCLALNHVFFSVGHEGAWDRLGELWERLWSRYLATTGDRVLLEVAPPFVAWRALVMANPQWYPQVSAESRDQLLSIVERTLAADRFEPDAVAELFL
jgi:aminoglycoside phosphotransferase (APT) family kinase protein